MMKSASVFIILVVSILEPLEGFVTYLPTDGVILGCKSISTTVVSAEGAGTAPVLETQQISTEINNIAVNGCKNPIDEKERRAGLLESALLNNSTAATDLLSEFNGLRSAKDSPQEVVEQFLNDLIDVVDRPLPMWTKVRFMRRFSRRGRLASLRRVLDMSTPTSSDEKESIGDDGDAEKRRRRRSLVILIRSLANLNEIDTENPDSDVVRMGKQSGTPRIAVLEKVARRDAKAAVASDIEKRLPPGLETPEYTVISKNPPSRDCSSGYEIRMYKPFTVCSVSMNKARLDPEKTDAKISNPQLKGASAFGALAGYLFGKNQQLTSMKMTTPVFSTQGSTSSSNDDGSTNDADKSMSFVLPSTYWDDDGVQTAPQPLDGSGVELRREEGGNRAVVMFGGFAGKSDVENKKSQLLKGLTQDSDWMPKAGATIVIAQYNDPFTPPWKRRNEVSIDVVPRTN